MQPITAIQTQSIMADNTIQVDHIVETALDRIKTSVAKEKILVTGFSLFPAIFLVVFHLKSPKARIS